MGLQDYPGWVGTHTREQAPGAMPNGSRVRKIMSKPGDASPDGSPATVLGSMHEPDLGYGYFVEWDARPRQAVFVAGFRLQRVFDG
jgi:hypothetical protein